jgi:hypothetical protein
MRFPSDVGTICASTMERTGGVDAGEIERTAEL